MPNPPEILEQPINKPSKYDKMAILVAKDNPDLSNNQIGKELVKLGASTNHRTIHDKWLKSDYLRRELTEVRQKNVSEIQRKLVPKSLTKLNKQLHNKDDKIQMQAIQTTLKYGMGEQIRHESPVNIQIGSIQAVIGTALSETLKTVSSKDDDGSGT